MMGRAARVRRGSAGCRGTRSQTRREDRGGECSRRRRAKAARAPRVRAPLLRQVAANRGAVLHNGAQARSAAALRRDGRGARAQQRERRAARLPQGLHAALARRARPQARVS